MSFGSARGPSFVLNMGDKVVANCRFDGGVNLRLCVLCSAENCGTGRDMCMPTSGDVGSLGIMFRRVSVPLVFGCSLSQNLCLRVNPRLNFRFGHATFCSGGGRGSVVFKMGRGMSLNVVVNAKCSFGGNVFVRNRCLVKLEDYCGGVAKFHRES